MKVVSGIALCVVLTVCFAAASVWGASEAFKKNVFEPGKLKPVDSVLRVKVGEPVQELEKLNRP